MRRRHRRRRAIRAPSPAIGMAPDEGPTAAVEARRVCMAGLLLATPRMPAVPTCNQSPSVLRRRPGKGAPQTVHLQIVQQEHPAASSVKNVLSTGPQITTLDAAPERDRPDERCRWVVEIADSNMNLSACTFAFRLCGPIGRALAMCGSSPGCQSAATSRYLARKSAHRQ